MAHTVLPAVEAAAKNRPDIAAAAAPFLAKINKAPKLRAAASLSPITLAGLDEPRRKQLSHANKLYGGKKMTPEQLFAGDEEEEVISPAMTSWHRIEDDKGKHTHDAWLYNADSGCIFKADTTNVVAEVIQGSLECGQFKLNLALKAALDGLS